MPSEPEAATAATHVEGHVEAQVEPQVDGDDADRVEGGSPASVWRNPVFRRFWYGHSVSQFGDRVSELALPLIAVVVLHATPGQVGALTAALWLPSLLSIVVGSWADHRLQKRRILVYADLGRAGVLLTVPLAYAFDLLSLPLLFAVAFAAGLGQVFFNTSYPPFFVSLVRRREYVDANAKLSLSRSASFIAGPAAGGALIQVLTAPVAVLVDAVTFLYSALVIGRLDVTDRPVDADADTGESWRHRVVKGARFVLADRYLRASLGCSTTINFFTFMSFALLILFASRDLGLSAGAIGLAFGVGSVGGLLGAAVAPRLSRRFGVGPMVVVGAVLFPAPLALVAVAGGPVWMAATVLAAAEFLSGLGVMIFDINLNSIQVSVIPDGLRSRVSGAYTTVNYGCRPLGAFIGGVLGSTIGLRETFVVAAVGGVLSTLFLVGSPIPQVRGVDRLRPASG